jgi:hypothetical protein
MCSPFFLLFFSVGAAAGCDLLMLLFKGKINRSQPAAAPTGDLRVAQNLVGAELARESGVSVAAKTG